MELQANPALLVRLQARKAAEIERIWVRARHRATHRRTRMLAAKATKLLQRIAGDERNPLAIAKLCAPVFSWPFEEGNPRRGRPGAWLRRVDGKECLFLRVDDGNQIIAGSEIHGIAIVLRTAMNEYSERSAASILEAVRAFCSEDAAS